MSAVATPRSSTRAPGAVLPGSEARTGSVAPVPLEHEDLVLHRGARSGGYVIVAVHSTVLGPALGGVRLWHYPATTDAIRDALRLARGMTFKAAAADSRSEAGRASSPHPGNRRAASSDGTSCWTSAIWSSRWAAVTSPPRTSGPRPRTSWQFASAPTM